MVGLNILKPLSSFEMRIAKKCGWAKRIGVKQKENIISHEVKPQGNDCFAKAKKTIQLTENQKKVMDIFRKDGRVATSPYCCVNMHAIFEMAKSEDGVKMLQTLLTPETVGKLDYQRILVGKFPKEYLKDKTEAKYLKSPAGLNSVFSDISLLKAAYIMDKDALNALFKMDITTGKGKALLNDIGRFNLDQLTRAKKGMTDSHIKSYVLDQSV